MRSYLSPIHAIRIRFESGIVGSGFLLKETLQHGRPFKRTLREKKKKSHGKTRVVAEKILAQKPREKSSPLNPIPIQRRCAHVLSIAAVLNQPLTRAPTRTPCGEAGSEDSWLRLLSGSNQSCLEDRPNRTTT